MDRYKIKSVANGKYVSIFNLTAGGILYENKNVVCKTATSLGKDQIWDINLSSPSNTFIRSTYWPFFGLNAYRTSDTEYNCDVYEIVGNETDATTEFITTSQGYYQIRLKNYPTKYLTASGTSGVVWLGATGGNDQLWSLEEVFDVPMTAVVHVISHKGYGNALNVYTSSGISDGTLATLWDWDNVDDQRWYFSQISGREYVIKSAMNQNCHLGYSTSASGETEYGYYRAMMRSDSANSYKVTLESYGDNNYRIMCNIGGYPRYLTAESAIGTNSTPTHLVWYPYRNNADQLWKLAPGTSYTYVHSCVDGYDGVWPTTENIGMTDGFQALWRPAHGEIDVPERITAAQPIYSMFIGTVTVSSYSAQLGYYVEIQSAFDNKICRYQHILQGSVMVSVGDEVMAGQQVGTVGRSGDSTGEHLHFEIMMPTTRTKIDPVFNVF